MWEKTTPSVPIFRLHLETVIHGAFPGFSPAGAPRGNWARAILPRRLEGPRGGAGRPDPHVFLGRILPDIRGWAALPCILLGTGDGALGN